MTAGLIVFILAFVVFAAYLVIKALALSGIVAIARPPASRSRWFIEILVAHGLLLLVFDLFVARHLTAAESPGLGLAPSLFWPLLALLGISTFHQLVQRLKPAQSGDCQGSGEAPPQRLWQMACRPRARPGNRYRQAIRW
jgi:hypothetical protein